MKSHVVMIVSCLLMGCAGRLETRPLQSTDERVNGVIFYQPSYLKVSYAFTALVDGTGKLVGTVADHACTLTPQKEELQIMPNLSKPYVLDLTPGFMNANKLSVTFANGLLTSVNAESTSKIPETVTALATLAEKVGAAVKSPEDKTNAACNAGSSIVGFVPIVPGR